ncbi:MAG: hypothetical protein GY754_02935 [bacterium]|nr:hypothetical protein [bacterium]
MKKIFIVLICVMFQLAFFQTNSQAGWFDDVVDWFEDAGEWVDDNVFDPIEDWIVGEGMTIINDAGTYAQLLGKWGENFFIGVYNSTIGAFDDDTDYDYLNSWTVKAMTFQNRISNYAPLRLAEFPSTHNSFNAQAYMTPTSYLDPNNIPSMLNQLNMGKRSINMDLHWDKHLDGLSLDNEVILCHDSSDEGFCSPTDRLFEQGLEEVKVWYSSPANQNEVIIIKFQDELDGHYSEALAAIESQIGELVFKPTTSCERLDLELTKADILKSGKKVILTGASSSSCSEAWGSYVFKSTGISGSVDFETFQPYPACQNESGSVNPDVIATKIYGSGNDGTAIGQIYLDDTVMNDEDVEALAKCGLTSLSFEPFDWWDSRHTAQVWSWSNNEPNDYNSNEDCAEQWSNGRFNDMPCTAERKYACQNPDTRDWKITSSSGIWSGGVQACYDEFGSEGYIFAVPVNGYENAKLADAKASAGETRIWINYSDIGTEGDWVAFGASYYESSSSQGGPGGGSFSDISQLSNIDYEVSKIIMRAGSRIDQIGVQLSNGTQLTHGGSGGSLKTLELYSGEVIMSAYICSAHTSKYNTETVHYAKFTTSLGRTLSGGKENGSCSTMETDDGIVGFWGGAGSEVDRLGVIFKTEP